jgi:High potential iron-sulfur protein
MQHEISRRGWVKNALLGTALIPVLSLVGRQSWAADLTPLDASDTTAKALSYVADASKVDAATHPTFKAGQRCATCLQYQGKATDQTAGCTIFPGHSVAAAGWCQVWAQRPA